MIRMLRNLATLTTMSAFGGFSNWVWGIEGEISGGQNAISAFFLTLTISPCFSTTDEKSMDIQMCELLFPRDSSFSESSLYKLSLNFVAAILQFLKPIHYALAKFQKSSFSLARGM